MAVSFLHYLSICLLFIHAGSSIQTMMQAEKNDNLDDQKLYLSKANRMLMKHNIYPIPTTNSLMHDTFPTDVPVGPTDVPMVNPSPTTGPPSTPTTGPPTGPYTTPTTSPPSGPTTPTTGSPTGPYPTPTTAPPTGPSTTPTTAPPAGPTTTTPPGGQTPISGGGGGGSGGGAWCVAKSGASEKALQVALDYACGYGADCSAIQSGGSCYNPNTVHDHASYAFNAFYQKNPSPNSCSFGGVAQLVNNDPSSGSCHYPSSGGSASTPPATPTPPTMQSPPDVMSPPSPMFPGPPFGLGTGSGGSGLGAEPIGSPNMATSKSQQMLLFFASTSIVTYILLVYHP